MKNIKKIIVTFLLCISVCFMLASCNKDDLTVPSGMVLASDKDVAYYSLFVPKTWTVDIQTGTTTAYVKSSSETPCFW